MTRVRVRGRHAVAIEKELYTTGSVGLKVAFEFDEAWDGLMVAVVFTDGTVKRDAILVNGECEIPHEVLVSPCKMLTVGVVGKDANLTVIIPTVYCQLDVIAQGATASGDPSLPPSPTVVDQILTASQTAVETAQSVRDDADAGLFDGEDGADGADGITPTIGENGNWYLGTTDTGKPSRGAQGAQGNPGTNGTDGADAKVNGYNTVSIEAGDNIEIEQTGNALKISGTGGGVSSWNTLTGKPFESLGETLQVDDDGVLNIVIPPEYGRITYNGFELTVS